MTTHHRLPVVCECGHPGIVHWSENDQPFSRQWERYSIAGFDGGSFEIAGWLTTEAAIERMNPRCPQCGAVGKVRCP